MEDPLTSKVSHLLGFVLFFSALDHSRMLPGILRFDLMLDVLNFWPILALGDVVDTFGGIIFSFIQGLLHMAYTITKLDPQYHGYIEVVVFYSLFYTLSVYLAGLLTHAAAAAYGKISSKFKK